MNCKQRWFSGRILACHAGGPGSIPGRCKFLFSESILFLDSTEKGSNFFIYLNLDSLRTRNMRQWKLWAYKYKLERCRRWPCSSVWCLDWCRLLWAPPFDRGSIGCVSDNYPSLPCSSRFRGWSSRKFLLGAVFLNILVLRNAEITVSAYL